MKIYNDLRAKMPVDGVYLPARCHGGETCHDLKLKLREEFEKSSVPTCLLQVI